MKVLILTNYYEEGPSSRYRSFNYEKYFKENNIIPDYRPLFKDGYVKNLYSKKKNNILIKIKNILERVIFLVKNKKKYDHIIIETELVKFFPFFLECFFLKGTSYSLDYDDNPNITYHKNNFLKIIYGRKIEKLSKNAKFVTVGNKWYFSQIKTNNLKYLPTVVDIDKYILKTDEINESNEDNKDIIIVWIGSPSTDKYLDVIKEPLRELSLEYNITLKIIGSDKKLAGVNIENVKWSEKTEVYEILSSDIGIMPLKDDFWQNGKCGFKLIQYMACELPVIASPSPANNEIIKHNVNGFIADSNKEWKNYLQSLIENKNLRIKMGKASREIVKKEYCYQIYGKVYSNYLKEKKCIE